jgi:hypothetical protein
MIPQKITALSDDILLAVPVVLVIAAFALAFAQNWLWAFFLVAVAIWIEVGL